MRVDVPATPLKERGTERKEVEEEEEEEEEEKQVRENEEVRKAFNTRR
jgi:hypothetical protein